MDDGLFSIDDPAERSETPPALMTPVQRQIIRELFAALGVTDARSQFGIVADLTGVNLQSVAELHVGPANVLIRRLRARVASSQRANTGNSWADREEDTWIDRL